MKKTNKYPLTKLGNLKIKKKITLNKKDYKIDIDEFNNSSKNDG
ncbi:hypothetical protein SCORR_v1c04130 [Spiroplasma corruscae]|uniref:Uncharacterized protein n=1 Tax=Spiroplasma corruscae TaxID=216934 RepID=A0A222ENW4_9MOLU|nr:hypothetical protein [Spiroplasma corruscae]ASP28187.1 hypothetical protein SCORR_v1c04130 [Spiroplasma corruscae]